MARQWSSELGCAQQPYSLSSNFLYKGHFGNGKLSWRHAQPEDEWIFLFSKYLRSDDRRAAQLFVFLVPLCRVHLHMYIVHPY